jgi:putative transposase
MEVVTRTIRGWQLGQAWDQTLTRLALPRALAQHTPEIHHSDQGVQYAATAYTQRLEHAGVQIRMAEVGEAWQKGYAERLMRTVKEEEVQLSEYVDYADVLRQVGRFLNEVYMHKRIHSALGYLTPAEFEEQWHRAQVQPLDVH